MADFALPAKGKRGRGYRTKKARRLAVARAELQAQLDAGAWFIRLRKARTNGAHRPPIRFIDRGTDA